MADDNQYDSSEGDENDVANVQPFDLVQIGGDDIGEGSNLLEPNFRKRMMSGNRMSHMFRDRRGGFGADRMSHMFRDRKSFGADRMSHMFRDRRFGMNKMSHLFRDKKYDPRMRIFPDKKYDPRMRIPL